MRGGIMKKYFFFFFIAISLIFLSQSVFANNTQSEKKFSFEVGAGIRSISNDLYKDVYDSPGTVISFDFGYRVVKQVEIFAHTDYFKKDGKLTLTEEDTTLKLIPIEFGVRYLFNVGKTGRIVPYIGLGGGFYSIKETNVIGDFNESKAGFLLEGGIKFYIVKSFFLDLKLKDVILKYEDTKLGGSVVLGGIGISF